MEFELNHILYCLCTTKIKMTCTLSSCFNLIPVFYPAVHPATDRAGYGHHISGLQQKGRQDSINLIKQTNKEMKKKTFFHFAAVANKQ